MISPTYNSNLLLLLGKLWIGNRVLRDARNVEDCGDFPTLQEHEQMV
jgi:hypothetical protein